MKDHMIRGTGFGSQVRFFAASTKATVEEARRIHDTYPLCTAALGRLLTAGAMMGAMGKNDTDIITLRIDGDGPIGGITVTADSHAGVKGIIYNNHVELPLRADNHLDVGRGVGKGTLSVIKDFGMKDPYVGQTLLHSGEIAEDLTYYFAESEQIPTSVALGVLVDTDCSVKQAGGFIIQMMPFASDETVSIVEKNLSQFGSVTNSFENGNSVLEMIKSIIPDAEIESDIPVKYFCNCSRDRVRRALESLGNKELQSMIDDGESVNLHCDFCNKDYLFTIDEIIDIKKTLNLQ